MRRAPERRPVPPTDPGWALVGRVLHERFRLDAVLVRGGMGTLLAGHDLVRDQPVVVKIVGGAVAPDARAADRLLREARLACRVTHPAIVRVLDLGMLETCEPFVAMERLDGEDLAAMSERGRAFSRAEVRSVADAMGDALAELHGAGVVHRDVKLENVLVLADPFRVPRPKLVDFGLAILDDDACTRLTRSGLLLGTPEYIAPECARGERASAASDVYALGVLLYELIAGRPPFEGARGRGAGAQDARACDLRAGDRAPLARRVGAAVGRARASARGASERARARARARWARVIDAPRAPRHFGPVSRSMSLASVRWM